MLRDLHVRNLAVLEEASVEFSDGFNVLTGETGAGKSIVVDALALLRGARANSDLLRTDSDRLSVIGRFEATDSTAKALLEAGLEVASPDAEAADILVRREISREGRSRAFINDQPVTANLLQRVMSPLLHIHAQREELGLATPELQRAFVDGCGGSTAESLLNEVAVAYETYAGLASRLEKIQGDSELRTERMDLLRFQLAEVEEAGLELGEDEELRTERDGLRHAEAIAQALGSGALELLEEDGSAVERIARAENALRGIEQWHSDAPEWVTLLESLRLQVTDVAESLRRELGSERAGPGRLDAVEERLTLIERLCRKFGGDVPAVLAFRDETRVELDQLESDSADTDSLERDIKEALDRYREVALELSKARSKWATELVDATQKELADLAMPKARLSVELDRGTSAASPLEVDGDRVQFGASGIDQVSLLLAANPGEEPKPLAKSASGGELSRIYLALRLATRGPLSRGALTMVFDEADAGLGGEAASALGRKLRELAQDTQILAVTHLAQVASFGNQHFGVRKRVDSGRTSTSVHLLTEDDRIEEVARMLAGDQMSNVSRSHAQELISSAAS